MTRAETPHTLTLPEMATRKRKAETPPLTPQSDESGTGQAAEAKPRRGRKPLPLTEEERRERRLNQNRKAQLGYRQRQAEAETSVYENVRRLKTHNDELRALLSTLQGALLAVLERLPSETAEASDVQLIAARALAAAPLPPLPELLPAHGSSVSATPPAPAPLPFADVAPLLSLGAAAFAPHSSYSASTSVTSADWSPLEPSSLLFPGEEGDMLDLLNIQFSPDDALMDALRTTFAPGDSQVRLDDVADELLRQHGFGSNASSLGFAEGNSSCALPEKNCSGYCADDEDRLRRCFDSLPHVTMRSLLHALQNARFGGVTELCADLKTHVRCFGSAAEISSWTMPKELFAKWPILRGIPMSERNEEMVGTA